MEPELVKKSEPEPEPWLITVPEPELDIKFCSWLPSFNIFSFTFYNKFVEIYKLFPCKTAYYVKRPKNFQFFFVEKFSFYGLDMELEPEPEP